MDNTSVVDALKAANLWKDTGRVPEQLLITVLPNGERAQHKMSEINYTDIQTLGIELDVALKFDACRSCHYTTCRRALHRVTCCAGLPPGWGPSS